MTYFLIITLISGLIMPSFVVKASASSYDGYDWLEEWLPQPGKRTDQNPFMPQSQVMNQTLQSNIQNSLSQLPSLQGQYNLEQSPFNPVIEDPVQLSTGNLKIEEEDLFLNIYGNPLSIQRTYNLKDKDKLFPFGYGWRFSYDYYIQMFADFNISEFKPDGSNVNYTYQKNDPNGLVDSYDGDPLIYYPLDQGTYSSTSRSDLERISKDEYQITKPDGYIYTFKGYKAPWRENADPIQGKLIAIKDRNGNTLQFNYDQQGHLIQIKSSDGRAVSLTYNNDLVQSITDPLGQVTFYEYEGKRLNKVKKPDGTSIQYTYDQDNRLLTITYPKTGKESFTYQNDRVVRYDQEGDLVYEYQYQDTAKKVVRIDALGNRTAFVFNDKKQIIQKRIHWGRLILILMMIRIA